MIHDAYAYSSFADMEVIEHEERCEILEAHRANRTTDSSPSTLFTNR